MSSASFGVLLICPDPYFHVVSAHETLMRSRLRPIVSAVRSRLNQKVKHGVVAGA
jgi:hypothetical protein